MSHVSSTRLPGLDHLRAAAILLVLLFHYRVYYGVPAALDVPPLSWISAFGWTGVDLFFVLSGYLIGGKLMADLDRHGRVRFGAFYVNRALRILPAYLVAVALYFLVAEFQEGRALQPLWRFLTFTQNLPMDLYANTFSHAWSLAVEEHFYLLLPAILASVATLGLRRQGAILLLALVALGLAVRYGAWLAFVAEQTGRPRLGAGMQYLYYPTYARLDGLIAGFAVAAIFAYRPALRARLERNHWALAALGFAGLIGCYHLFGGNILSGYFTRPLVALIGFPLLSLCFALLLVALLSPNNPLHAARFRPSLQLALYAYAIYLVHKMSNHWLNANLRTHVEVSDTALFLICLAVAFVGGALLHHLIEKPFLILRDRISLRMTGGGAVEAA